MAELCQRYLTALLVPCSKGDKHILISTMNHAGLDALNAFVIYNSFLNYIGLLSAGKFLIPLQKFCLKH